MKKSIISDLDALNITGAKDSQWLYSPGKKGVRSDIDFLNADGDGTFRFDMYPNQESVKVHPLDMTPGGEGTFRFDYDSTPELYDQHRDTGGFNLMDWGSELLRGSDSNSTSGGGGDFNLMDWSSSLLKPDSQPGGWTKPPNETINKLEPAPLEKMNTTPKAQGKVATLPKTWITDLFKSVGNAASQALSAAAKNSGQSAQKQTPQKQQQTAGTAGASAGEATKPNTSLIIAVVIGLGVVTTVGVVLFTGSKKK